METIPSPLQNDERNRDIIHDKNEPLLNTFTTCPCFHEDDLDLARNNILGLNSEEYTFSFDTESSCTRLVDDAITYMVHHEQGDHPVKVIFGVGDGYCKAYDELQSVDTRQQEHCLSLIEHTCLDIAYVASDDRFIN